MNCIVWQCNFAVLWNSMNSPATHSTFFNLHYVINAIEKIFNIVVYAIQKVFIEFRIKPMSRFQSQKLLNNTRNHIRPASVTLLILKNSFVNSPNASLFAFSYIIPMPQDWTPMVKYKCLRNAHQYQWVKVLVLQPLFPWFWSYILLFREQYLEVSLNFTLTWLVDL